MNTPGMDNPMATETKVISTLIKVMMGTISDLNQFKAIRLGVFKIKIPPIADESEPSRQIYEL